MLAVARGLSVPPASAGATLARVATPALLVDMEVFERNCHKLRGMLEATGVRARPHAKAHKSGYLALKQLEILGDVASGVCAQTVTELEAMVAAGVPDVLLTNQCVGADKLRRLRACLDGAAGRVGVLVDDAGQVGALDAAVAGADGALDVFVEVGAERQESFFSSQVAPGSHEESILSFLVGRSRRRPEPLRRRARRGGGGPCAGRCRRAARPLRWRPLLPRPPPAWNDRSCFFKSRLKFTTKRPCRSC